MPLAEFLEWEERQEPLFEFDGVGPVAMTGEEPLGEMWVGQNTARYEKL